jgi:hypothetical protein
MTLSKRQILGLVACGLLIIGVFLPIVSFPIMGGINYFQNGHGDGMILLILAGISVVFVVLQRFQVLWLTGTGSLGLLLFTWLNIYFRIEQLSSEFEKNMEGNPFSGLA